MRRARLVMAATAVAVLVSAQAGTAAPGFHTKGKPMVKIGPDAPTGSVAKALIASGDVFSPTFTFEGIPDGIGWVDNGDGTIDVYVTHEQSRVPFPVAVAPSPPNPGVTGLKDFVDASISRLTINTANHKIVDAEVALPPSEGFIRFCSAFMAGAAEGFVSPVFFANEESDDDLVRPATAIYPADPFFPAADNKREAGYAVALDVATGTYTEIAGMGRHNHENTVVVPGGWSETVALSGDDTFVAPASQLYMYKAATPAGLVADSGHLFAFRVTATGPNPGDEVDEMDPFNGANDYGDIVVGDDWEGEFIEVPDDVADGTLTTAAPQAGLENWSNTNNVFQFIRVEDIAYDKNDPNVVYFADTGERRARPDLDPSDLDDPDGRLDRGPSSFNGPYPNGRIFRMEFSPTDPLVVTSFSILLNNDLGGLGNPDVMHQPDNIDTSLNSLMVQEDSGQPPTSRIWRYDFAAEEWSVVASVRDQAWESSGIVDASAVYGEGSWLITVQAHNVFVDQSAPLVPGTTVEKREGGQLLLLSLPGT